MKEDAGAFTTLDSEKIYPVSNKLNQSKSSPKLGFINQQQKERNRIEAAISKNRPQPLEKTKYMSSEASSPSVLRNSMTQIRSQVAEPIPKASKSARKFFSKRGGSKKRKVLKNKLF